MADLENRVDKLEEKVDKLEKDINKSLNDIKLSLTEISTTLRNNANNDDLKNELIAKDVQNNTNRIAVIESTIAKITWVLVMAVIGVAGEAIFYFIQNKP